MDEHNQMPREEDRPIAVEISDDFLKVTLQDGRVIATPLDWYPRLKEAAPEELRVVELGFSGIHWPLLDEDLSVRGMLAGNHPPKPQIIAKQEA
ncbi:MAG: hypothetical protein BroJett018_41760 [Chloroflexota bacterium]|nr:MAG: hypothetical protein BroJett018_41760 [Chloroflexota bacterium]